MAELDAVNTEVQAPPDPMGSSAREMLPEKSKGPGEDMALPGSEERQQQFSTAKTPSEYVDGLLKFISHENSILVDLQTHIFHLQKEVSLLHRVSVQPGAAKPDKKVLDAKATDLERKEEIIDNMNKECSDALDEIAVFRENEQRTAAQLERLEAALRAKVRDLQELD
ncbi:hypothetical protein RUND412_003840 [Rhizina undulata]